MSTLVGVGVLITRGSELLGAPTGAAPVMPPPLGQLTLDGDALTLNGLTLTLTNFDGE